MIKVVYGGFGIALLTP
nr:hypothetical protein [Vibrio parahaemolyticus]